MSHIHYSTLYIMASQMEDRTSELMEAKKEVKRLGEACWQHRNKLIKARMAGDYTLETDPEELYMDNKTLEVMRKLCDDYELDGALSTMTADDVEQARQFVEKQIARVVSEKHSQTM